MSAEDEFDIDEEVQSYLEQFQYYPKDAVQLMTYSKERTGKKRRYSDVNRSLRQWISTNRDLYESRSPYVSTDTEIVNAYSMTSSSTATASSSTESKKKEPEWQTLDESDEWDWDKIWADYIKKYDTHPKKAVHLWNHCKELRIRLKYSEARTEYPKLKARLLSGDDKATDSDLSSAASSSSSRRSKHGSTTPKSSSGSRLLATPAATAEFRKMSATGIYISKVDRMDVNHKEKVFAIDIEHFECFWRAYMKKYQLNPGFPKNLYVFINETFPEIISELNRKSKSEWDEDEEKMADLALNAEDMDLKHYTYKAVNNAFKRWSGEMREKCADLLCKKKERRQSVVNASAISDLVQHVASEEAGRTISESLDTATESVKKEDEEEEEEEEADENEDEDEQASASSFSAGRASNGSETEEEQNEEEDNDTGIDEPSQVSGESTAVPTGSSDNEGELTPPDSPPQPAEMEDSQGLAGGKEEMEDDEDDLSDLEAAQNASDAEREDSKQEEEDDVEEEEEEEDDQESEGAEGTDDSPSDGKIIQDGIDLSEDEFRVILKGYKAEFGADRLPDSASQLVKWANGYGHQVKFGAVKRAMSYYT